MRIFSPGIWNKFYTTRFHSNNIEFEVRFPLFTLKILNKILLRDEIIFKQLSRGRSLFRIRLETPENKLLRFLRQLGRDLRMHFVEADLEHGGLRRAQLDEGRLPGRHLNNRAAQRPKKIIKQFDKNVIKVGSWL